MVATEKVAGEFGTENSGRCDALAIELTRGAHRIHLVAQSRWYALAWSTTVAGIQKRRSGGGDICVLVLGDTCHGLVAMMCQTAVNEASKEQLATKAHTNDRRGQRVFGLLVHTAAEGVGSNHQTSDILMYTFF
jgi:hypothetical protein